MRCAHKRWRQSPAPSLLTNIVLAWNVSGMGGVVARLKRDGDGIEEDGLRQMGPAHFSQAGMSACRHVGNEMVS